MIQIIVTLGAFAVFCIAFFFMRLFGVEWTMEQPLSRCAGYMVASLVALGVYIAYRVYRHKHPKEEKPDENTEHDVYDKY